MSRLFAAASSQYIESTTAPTTAAPLSMAVWVNATTLGAVRSLICIGSSTQANYFDLGHDASGNGFIETSANNGVSQEDIFGTTAQSTATWFHLAAVFTSVTSRTLYVNGTAEGGTGTVNLAPTSLDRVTVGALSAAGHFGYGDAQLAEAAIWSVALGADEVVSLAQGFAPSLVRPASLTMWCPCWGQASPEVEMASQLTMTLTAAPTAGASHPPMLYPAEALSPGPATAAPPLIPSHLHSVPIHRAASW